MARSYIFIYVHAVYISTLFILLPFVGTSWNAAENSRDVKGVPAGRYGDVPVAENLSEEDGEDGRR